MMEVGAMMVGRITNHEAEPGYVTRGEEKGFSWVHVSYDAKNLKRQILAL